MAANTIPSPCPKSNLTRRAALRSTACVGALALPAGVAVAAVKMPGDDPNHPLVALWHQYQALIDAVNESCADEDDPRWRQVDAIEAAIDAARPADLPGLTVQLRFIERMLCIGSSDKDIILLGSIAAALSRLSGVEVGEDTKMLSGWRDEREA